MAEMTKSPCLRTALFEWMTCSFLGVRCWKQCEILFHTVGLWCTPKLWPSTSLMTQWWLSGPASLECTNAYVQIKCQGNCFLLLGCLVLRGAHLWFYFLTTELMFFRHRMPHSVPVYPPWPHLDVLHHGCHAEHGQVQLLCWQVRNTIFGGQGRGL